MKPVVLVVDDEDYIREMLTMLLELHGFQVEEAEDGFEALNIIQSQTPDVIILDVMMPNMDGFTTCQELRSRPETAELPIILLSARSQVEAVRTGLQSGADRYMTKPISKPELVQTITDLLAGVSVVGNP